MTTWLWHLMDRWERHLLLSPQHVYHVDHKDLMMDFKEAGDDPNKPPGPPKMSFGPPTQPWAWVGPVLFVALIVVLGLLVVFLGTR
jgi:hypothetical protein